MRTLLALALCATPALAQFPPTGGYQLDYEKQVALPPFTNASRIVFGEIAGGKLPGALALVDGVAYGVFDPETHDVAFPIETGVIDLDVVAAVGGEAAGMILARPQGLYRYEWDSAVGASPPITSASISSLVVDLVRTADVDGQGLEDIVCAAGSTVHVLLESGGTWNSAGTFTAGGAVRDLVSIDWDGDPSSRLHVAALVELAGGGTRVEIWGQQAGGGYVLDETFGGAQEGFLAPLHATTAEPVPRVAWTTDITGLGSYLLLIGENGERINCGQVAPPAALGSALLRDTASGLSRMDLMTISTQDVDARVYEYLSGTPPYSAGSPLVHATGSTVSAGDRAAAFGDATADHVPDILVARASTNELIFVAGQQPSLASVQGSDAWSLPTLHGTNDRLGVRIKIPSDLPTTINRAQLILWAGTNGTLQAQALKNHKYEIPSGQSWMWAWVDLAAGEEVCDGGGDGVSLDYEYYIDVRFVVVSDDGDGDDVLDGTSSLHAGVLYTEEAGIELNVTCSGNQSGGVKFLPLATLPGTGGQLPEIPPLTDGPTSP
jgi:hypothetical protein